MNYEQKYKEALGWMRSIYPTMQGVDKEDAEHYFPELKESEDEMIKKMLIRHITQEMGSLSNDEAQMAIAWLEKQGEQNPTDKVEPKFNVGDWVMLDRPVLITKVEDMPYNTHQYWTSDGKWFGDATKAKLWTIQDAKDGDVLVTEIEDEPNYFIYIFKEYDQSLGFWSYCYLDAYTNKFHEGIYHNNCNIGVPASKEQRVLLFSKMKEAGYEWDAEKKELKKIEQKPIPKFKIGDTIHKIGENTVFPMTIEKIEDGDYVCNNSHSFVNIKFQDYYELVEEKSSWSEEDVKIVESLLKIVEAFAKEKNSHWFFDDFSSSEMIDWLKSIKPNHWKPSEEQLNEVINAIGVTGTNVIVLLSLYNDLKKL